MNHDLFPSGPWTGFYTYRPKDRHRMDLDLTFANGKLTGDGHDDVGRFKVRGDYSEQTLECSWTKTYVGAHSVFYRGFREGKGIWGTWEITLSNHGGFHIWPKRRGAGDAETTATEAKQPAGPIEKRERAVQGCSAAKSPPAFECADLSALLAGGLSPSNARSASEFIQRPAERGPALATRRQSDESGAQSPHSKIFTAPAVASVPAR
jgi:hypothetical protein